MRFNYSFRWQKSSLLSNSAVLNIHTISVNCSRVNIDKLEMGHKISRHLLLANLILFVSFALLGDISE